MKTYDRATGTADDTADDTASTASDVTTSSEACFPLAPIPSRQHQSLDQGSKLAIYLAGSRATEQFLKPLGVTAYQIGLTGRRHVDDRILDKRKRRYGSILADPHNPADSPVELPLGGDVFLTRIDDAMLQGTTIPAGLSIDNGVVTFMVKPGVTVEQVDKLLSNALKDRDLNHYLGTGEGQRRMRQAGHNPRHRVMTRYSDIGTHTRLSLAQEIFLIRPRRELKGLLDLIAHILRSHLVHQSDPQLAA